MKDISLTAFRLSLLVLSLFVIAGSTPIYAQNVQKGLQVNPAYSDITLESPNEEKTIEIKYSNNTDQPLSLNLSPQDFRQNENGLSYSFVDDSKNYSYSLSSFLSLESDSIEVLPHQSKIFKVKVKNREDISPGGHYAAIIAKFSTDDKTPGNKVIPALTSLVLLRKVGGEHFQLLLQEFSFPNFSVALSEPDRIYLTFRNDGNIHLIPYGRVDITDQFGRLVKKGVINEDSKIIFPESKRDILSVMQDQSFELPISWNTIQIYGQDSLKKVSYQNSRSYLYVNPIFILVLFLIISGLVYLAKTHQITIKTEDAKEN